MPSSYNSGDVIKLSTPEEAFGFQQKKICEANASILVKCHPAHNKTITAWDALGNPRTVYFSFYVEVVGGTFWTYTVSAYRNFDGVDNFKNLVAQCGKGEVAGNPITVNIGNKHQREPIVSSSVSSAFRFDWIYNSHPNVASAELPNWRHTYQRGVTFVDSIVGEIVVVDRPDGSRYTYTPSGTQWITDDDVKDKLESLQDANGTLVGWRYTSANNTVELYGENGKLESITDLDGNIQTLSYDIENRLEDVNSGTGQFLNFVYDVQNHIISMSDDATRTWGYRYDANNNLEYVDNPDGTSKQYH